MRERPCVECGLPVRSMPRGPPKRIHEECKRERRKLYDYLRAERKAQAVKK